MMPYWPRALDHCVLATTDLDGAAARLAALGFQVAPMGVHPFGTANRCVYFGDDSFLEMLATVDPTRAAESAAAGNVFVRHHLETAADRDAFSAIVFKTDDASRDHDAFAAAGASAGRMLEFSRQVRDPTGKAATATFRLAFATSSEAPDILVFTCQRVAVPAIDRSALTSHPNGVSGIVSVTTAGAAQDALDPVRDGLTPSGGRFAVETIAIDPWDYATPVFAEEPRLSAITFAVTDLDGFETRLRDAGIDYIHEPGRLAVPPAPGQGATFVFEAHP
ncbi:MAG: VOC family protein [Rhizobiaceae bacterium]|nr:VOC family protein [Rhizobiaceae bacterium]